MSRRRNADEELVALPSDGSEEEDEYEDSEDDVPGEEGDESEEDEDQEDVEDEEDDGDGDGDGDEEQSSEVKSEPESKKRKLENSSSDKNSSLKRAKSVCGVEDTEGNEVESTDKSSKNEPEIANDKDKCATTAAGDREQPKDEAAE